MENKIYKIRLKCDNCGSLQENEVKFGTQLSKGWKGFVGTIDGPYWRVFNYFVCKNCGCQTLKKMDEDWS